MTSTNRTIPESLDRHRSPSATEIYSTARTYLQNTNDPNQLNSETTLSTFENEGEKNESSSLHSTDPDSYKVERRKKHKQRISGQRKRTSSSETVERIPQPSATERSRSVEMIHGIERIELERSKTESILSSSDTSGLESSNSSLGQIQSTKLMSLSLGRGQSLSSGGRLDSGRSRSNSKDISDGNLEERSSKMSDEISSALSDEASIQEYIGQTFPLVKNIDRNEFVASSIAATNSSEKKHPASQPLPSQVASITRSNFHTYSQPPLSNNSGITDEYGNEKSIHFTPSSGKKNRSTTNSQRRHQNNLNGVALASLDSTPSHLSKGKETESTSKTSQQQTANFISPPRKVVDLSTQLLSTTPSTNSSNILSKDKSSHNRTIEKISWPGSNHPSRSNSPVTKKEFDENESKTSKILTQNDEVQISVETHSSTEENNVMDSLRNDNRAEINDRLVREKLQEVKAMNRQDSSNGAVMYQFSLWKGVQRKDPIPDISLPRKVTESNETPSRPPRSEISEDSSQKKSRRRGPRAIIEAQDDVSSDPKGFISNPEPIQIHPEISRQSPFTLRKGPSLHSKESSEEEKYSESEDENENFSEEYHSSGRAYAFRSMVGSCKTSNLSCGSIAESIQTELGVPKFYLNAGIGIDESLSSQEEDPEEEEMSLAISEYDEDAAIFGIALEHDSSFISDDNLRYESEVDQSSATQYSHSFDQQVLQPKFSLELSLDAIHQPLNHQQSSHDPPLIKKKRDQSRTLTLDDDEGNHQSVSILVSSSLPEIPTKTEIPPQMIRRKSSSSGHTKRIREMTSAAKLESTVDENILDQLQESRKTDNSSPSLLSEASEYDTFENDSNLEDKNYHNPITSTTDDTQRMRTQNHPQHPHPYQYPNANFGSINTSKRPSVPNDEIYSIHDFQWKKGNEILGEGSFGQVFKGMNCSTGELLAVKQICLTDGTEEEVNTLRQEIDLMDSLKHPNIVRYVGTSISSRYLYIVLEYVPGGSVAGMLSQFGSFSEILIRRLVSQIMQGVDYLHQKGIIHRDIKGANVLVTDAGVAKLADFGCSKQLAGLCTTSLEESMRTIRGSVPWMAPEVIKQTGHGRSADIWSIGATIIEMATAKPPWQEFSNNLAALFHVATSEHPPPIPSGLTQECADFIGRCMKIDPKERATSRDLLMDPFLLALIVTTKTTE